MELAREDRPATLAALQRLRDQTREPRIALEASTILARYSDGEPGAHNVPLPPEPADAEADLDTSPPELSAELESTLDETARRGGDAGDAGQGNGGGA